MHAKAIRNVVRKAPKTPRLEPVPSIDEATIEKLIAAARAVREKAHAPYSQFKVGAAVLGADGGVFAGCNVENSSYGLSVCAERNAVAAAVAGGEKSVVAVVVATQSAEPSPPCGTCRQVLSEFGDPLIVLVNNEGHEERLHLNEIFPRPFSRDYL